ncbi:MAG TPA: ribosome maturation factor RimM [Ornithinimicrobium sp.]|uniref:ribosome maturation factor RimM n=1 Tax=Ornithinimicrobium sp. TaxID=1977084 RepID=UPI002B47B580|nr:ribosome maturation factor RimM [Ornithinimicrobium sp.]HKJ11816.1 ribosome maturation factor RimM [Ornithinimicrobium sp.]
MPVDDVPETTPRVIARVGKPHGLRGEVTVEIRTDDPVGRLAPGTVVAVDPAERGPLTVHSARVHQGVHLLGFDGVTDRSQAERLRGLRLITRTTQPHGATRRHDEDDPEEYYEDEVVGLAVQLPSGAPVGYVSALHTRPAQDLLEVRTHEERTALVPFVAALVPLVDIPAGLVVIDPPPGLLELDA